MKERYIINVTHDADVNVYIGTCDEVQGLIVEEPTIEALVRTVADLLPELVADEMRHDLQNNFPPLVQFSNLLHESRAN